MWVEVLFFAAARDAAGRADARLELPEGTSAERALELLGSRYPNLHDLVPSLRLAVNEEFVAAELVLRDGDCLALIPPVSGG